MTKKKKSTIGQKLKARRELAKSLVEMTEILQNPVIEKVLSERHLCIDWKAVANCLKETSGWGGCPQFIGERAQ